MKKVLFDIFNTEHIRLYHIFLETGSWKHTGGCPFELQKPWVSVPHMIEHFMARQFISNTLYGKVAA
jgi:hypothetical protein